MKAKFSSLLLSIALLFSSSLYLSAATLSGTYTLPGSVNGTTVNNLTDLATLLNGGANTVSGTVIFEFTSSYTSTGETYPITFSAYSGTGNVVIRPAVSVSTPLSTSGSPGSTALLNLSGVRNLTFDGRPGGAGTTPQWQVQNTAASGSYPAIQFINGAAYDSLEYLIILSSGTSSTATILLSTSTVSGGNSYDLIGNCNIGNYSGYPYNPVLSVGTAGANANGNNSILNNNIYNFATYNNNSPYYAGINISSTGNGSNWTINGNSIYSTINYLSLGSTPYHAIYFNAGPTSTGNIISGNYIGGQQPHCAGASWVVPSYQANGYADFDGIAVAAGSSTVSNNTIQNIFMGSRYGSSTFRGINILSGTANVTGNLIGSASDTGSIVSGLYGTMLGIQNQSTTAVTINNNIIAGFTSDGRAYNPTYSGTTTGVSIGIYAYSSSTVVGATTITNNSIYNFSRNDNYNNNLYFPVDAGGGSQVSGQNIIYEMNILAGICVETAGAGLQTISKNTIHTLFNRLTGGTNKTYINGIVDHAGTGGSLVNGNLVYGLYAPDTYGSSGYYTGLNGIYIPVSTSSGTNTITNNMIDLGFRPTDGSSIQNALITGIWDNTAYNGTTLKVKCIHNSVYIGGTNTNAFSNNLNSYAFRRVLDYGSSVYDSLALYNNIFVNNRTNSTGTAINYGIYLNSTTDAASDYNEIYGTGTGFQFGDAGGTDYATLATYTSANTGFETHSLSSEPLYVSPATATPNLHVQSTTPIDGQGTPAITLVYDFDSLLRANYSPVDIGASVNCSSSAAAAVSLTVSQDTVCSGTAVTFTATPTNGGTSPTYNFYKNNVSVQNGASNTYTISSPANKDSVKVVITSNAACVSPATATSNSITISVNSNTVTPAITISPSQNNFCQGGQVTFTTTISNGGSAPAYNFYLNGNSVQNGSGSSYSNSNLHSADSVWVVLTSNASCLSTATATSSKVNMVVMAAVVPSVSISPSQSTICANTPVTFTATATNGGTPGYNFYRNGSSVQNGSSNTYINNNLSNNDSVWVVITSTATCASPTTAASSKVHMVVNTLVTPAISISTPSNTICSNASATFSSSIANGGPAPAYQWKKNGSNVATGATYLANGLTSGDVVSCILTSDANCAAPDSALSNAITMTVTGTVTPTISITSTTPQPVCTGTPVSFTVTIANGGSAPTYVWKLNGLISGGSTTTYLDANPHNGDIVQCVLTSDLACASPTNVPSNFDTVVVHPSATTILSPVICQGDSFMFAGQVLKQTGSYYDTLSSVYGCDSVIIAQLTVNNIHTTVNSASICFGSSYNFNGRTLSQTGSYTDTLTGFIGCDSLVTLNLTVSSFISIQTGAYICNGDTFNFNGRPLTTAGTYYDTLTTGTGCDSAVALNLIVFQKMVPVITLSGTDSLSTAYYPVIQWIFNQTVIPGATSASYVAPQNGSYVVAVRDTNGCKDTSVAQVVISVSVAQLLQNTGIQLYPNPATTQCNIRITGTSGNILYIRLFDIYGNLVYSGQQEIITGNSAGTIQLNQLAAGIYIVRLLSDELDVSKRIEVVK